MSASHQHQSKPQGPLDHLIFYFGAAGMLGLFGLVFYGVVMRFVFSKPPLWSVDLPNLVFIWLVFVTVGLTTPMGPQIRVVFFLDRMAARTQKIVTVAGHLAILVMIAAFIWFSVPIIELSMGQTVLSLGWSGSVYFYALPVGCVVMAYYQIKALIDLLRPAAKSEETDAAS